MSRCVSKEVPGVQSLFEPALRFLRVPCKSFWPKIAPSVRSKGICPQVPSGVNIQCYWWPLQYEDEICRSSLKEYILSGLFFSLLPINFNASESKILGTSTLRIEQIVTNFSCNIHFGCWFGKGFYLTNLGERSFAFLFKLVLWACKGLPLVQRLSWNLFLKYCDIKANVRFLIIRWVHVCLFMDGWMLSLKVNKTQDKHVHREK